MTAEVLVTWLRERKGPGSPLGVPVYKTSVTSSIFQSPEECKIDSIHCHSDHFSLIKLICPI